MKKILFVCAGNICRSPLAHGIFLHMAKREGLLDYFEIESCGIGGWHVGEFPDERMIKEAAKHGVVLDHIARKFQVMDPEYFDLILAMDISNYNNIKLLAHEEYYDKIRFFREFDKESKEEFPEVPDPYYGGEKGFSLVYEIVERTCENLLEELKER